MYMYMNGVGTLGYLIQEEKKRKDAYMRMLASWTKSSQTLKRWFRKENGWKCNEIVDKYCHSPGACNNQNIMRGSFGSYVS